MERTIKLTPEQTRSAFAAAWARASKLARYWAEQAFKQGKTGVFTAKQFFPGCLKAIFNAYRADNFENLENAERELTMAHAKLAATPTGLSWLSVREELTKKISRLEAFIARGGRSEEAAPFVVKNTVMKRVRVNVSAWDVPTTPDRWTPDAAVAARGIYGSLRQRAA